jgi:tetratricopeptide (TPR) repeat protein/predicted Ser/Thr protein kinase
VLHPFCVIFSERMDCPSADTLERHVLDGEPDDALARHVEGCARCGQLIDALRTLPAAPTDEARLPADTPIGRYRVLHFLGKGGMGAVYAARDPELDRVVAVKLLAAQRLDEPETRARLQREAQALARLSHRNVVAIYDVGTSAHGVFIAMELIEGDTLRRWLGQPRSRSAIIATLIEAGRGLAAAHDAGLVHRDFKPENVLIGRDGRVCVTDFGLARIAGSVTSSDGSSQPSPLSSPITQQGAIPGTPAYMAPEQLSDGLADVRSDIFSFCVTAWEALAGVSPFSGRSRRQLLAAMVSGRPQPGRIAAAPRRLRRLLLRGLAAAPDARPPSMAAVLAVLSPRPRRWGWIAAGAGAVVLGALVVAATRPAPCDASGFALVWNGTARAALERGFAATKLSYAADSAHRAEAALDAYAAGWHDLASSACQTARVRHEQSSELFDLRMQCLDERRDAAGALIAVLEHADRATVEHAVAAAQSLPTFEACANAATLRSVLPPPRAADQARALDGLERRLHDAESLERVGRYADASKQVAPLVEGATAFGYPPLLARVLTLRGRLEMNEQKNAVARETFVAAMAAATRGRDDRRLAESLLGAAHSLTEHEAATATESEHMLSLAAAVIDRLGDEPRLRARLLFNQGTVQLLEHRNEAAVTSLRQSIALEPDGLERASTLNALGVALLKLHRLAEAREPLEQAVSALERELGPLHPRCGVPRYVLAELLKEIGPLDAAEAAARRALEVYRASLPPSHPRVLGAMATLAEILTKEGRTAEALALLQQAFALQPPADPRRQLDRVDLALVLAQTGNATEAMRTIDAALDETKQPLYRAMELLTRGQLRLEAHQAEPAWHDYEAAKALFTAEPGQDEGIAEALIGLGEARLAARRPKEAQPILAQALALADQLSPGARARAEFAMARAITDDGGDAARARSLADTALQRWAPLGAWGAREAAKIREWQRDHAP